MHCDFWIDLTNSIEEAEEKMKSIHKVESIVASFENASLRFQKVAHNLSCEVGCREANRKFGYK